MTQDTALKILKIGANVFLTGEPGSGKTHTVNKYVSYLRSHNIEVAITASTGIAATHIGGMTIHSWSGVGIKRSLSRYDLDKIASTEYIARRIKRTKVLIIDEISMIDANMFDMVDAVCREVKQNREPFGGIQVVVVGDFFQLPPVASVGEEVKFAYESKTWRNMRILTCYLGVQYRQSDEKLSDILNAIRSGDFDQVHYENLMVCQRKNVENKDQKITKLFSHNIDVDALNDDELKKIPANEHVFNMKTKGPAILVSGLIKGCLSPETLRLKVGASVMFTKNNKEKNFANGTLGVVKYFESSSGYPVVELRDGTFVTVEPMDWVLEEGGKIRASITQIPLRLAWAITIHKSQGMSLDCAVMDLGQVFEYGQGYVALSRVKDLDGLYLLGVNNRAFQVHPEILEKDTEFKKQSFEVESFLVDLDDKKLNKMYEDFIIASGGDLIKDDKIIKTKKDTYSKTSDLILQEKSLDFISKERGLSVDTVINHFEKLADRGDLKYEHILPYFEPNILESLDEIHKIFTQNDSTKLTPVFEYFGGRFSYIDLKLARIAFKLK